MKPLAELVPPNIATLKPYQPGKPIEEVERELGISGVIKIASNENPMGPSPKAVDAAIAAMHDVHWYPDGGAFHLRRAVAEHVDCAPEQLVFGSGADELIHMIVKAFCRRGVDEVLTHKYAFISYRLAALALDVPFVEAAVTGDLRCDVDDLISRITDRTRVIFLANPNNPTGAHLERSELERVLEAAPVDTLVVIDEAYHEYAISAWKDYPRSQPYIADRPRLITLRTFSKIYGLAGMRVGYAISSPEVADFLSRVKLPFNVNSVAQAAALAALADTGHVQKSCEAAQSGIASIRKAAEDLDVRPFPSLGNFVLVDVGRESAAVYDGLLRRGVIVRPMAAWGLKTHIRVSVGTPEEIERAVEALKAELG